MSDLPPLMLTTPGYTPKKFAKEPLMTEGEATSGPDDANPFRSAEEREIVKLHREKRQAQIASDIDLMDAEGISAPIDSSLDESPTEGDDPFVFDDVGLSVPELRFPFAENDKPEF